MKKFTAFRHNISIGQILTVPDAYIVTENQDALFSIGLRDNNIFQSNGLTVFNIVLHEKNLPNKVFQSELNKRLDAEVEKRGLSGDEIMSARERIMQDIISQALTKTSTHKVYLNSTYLLIEASGKQCEAVWRFLKGLLSELTEFKEFKTAIFKVEQTRFNEAYKNSEATKVTCKIDEENSMSLKGSDLIEDEAETLKDGEIKQFSSVTEFLEYTVNNKLVFSGIKFFNDLESDEEALDLEHASYLFPLVDSWYQVSTKSKDFSDNELGYKFN